MERTVYINGVQYSLADHREVVSASAPNKLHSDVQNVIHFIGDEHGEFAVIQKVSPVAASLAVTKDRTMLIAEHAMQAAEHQFDSLNGRTIVISELNDENRALAIEVVLLKGDGVKSRVLSEQFVDIDNVIPGVLEHSYNDHKCHLVLSKKVAESISSSYGEQSEWAPSDYVNSVNILNGHLGEHIHLDTQFETNDIDEALKAANLKVSVNPAWLILGGLLLAAGYGANYVYHQHELKTSEKAQIVEMKKVDPLAGYKKELSDITVAEFIGQVGIRLGQVTSLTGFSVSEVVLPSDKTSLEVKLTKEGGLLTDLNQFALATHAKVSVNQKGASLIFPVMQVDKKLDGVKVENLDSNITKMLDQVVALDENVQYTFGDRTAEDVYARQAITLSNAGVLITELADIYKPVFNKPNAMLGATIQIKGDTATSQISFNLLGAQ